MIDRVARRFGGSYRLRLTLGFVAVIVVLTAAWAVSLFGPVTDAVVRQQEDHLALVARANARDLQETLLDAAAFAKHTAGDENLRVTLIAEDGTVLGDSRNAASSMENHARRPEVAAALRGETGRAVRTSATEGVAQVYVAVPATFNGRPVVLRISESQLSVDQLAGQARGTGLVALGLAILVSVFVAMRLGSFANAPVTRLAAEADAIARGEQRTVVREAGELGVVSDALTDLGSQVRQRIGESEAEREKLRTVLDGLDEAVLLVEGDVVRLANSAASALFKTPHGGWLGKPLRDTGLPASLLGALRDVGDCEDRCVRDVGPDPTGRVLRLSVARLSDDGAVRRLLVTIGDITERAHLDATRRDFVTNASHELKTPTAAITLLAESAEAAAEDGDAEQSLAFVGQMRAEAARLRRLVADLHDLSRLEAPPADEAIADVRAAVDLAITGHAGAAGRKGLDLTVDARTIPAFDNDAMIAAVRGAVSSEVEVLSSRLKPVAGDPESRIARAALSAVGAAGATGFPSVSDLAHLGGRPAIVFGPGTPGESHRADESIAIDALLAAPGIYRRAIAAYFA
jgi:two-component system phosphate regulon sensor histidine kinase PhoR